MPHLSKMLPSKLKEMIERKVILLIPVGSIEYHGEQLPLGTDLFICEHIAFELEKRTEVVVAPSVIVTPTGYAVSGAECGTMDIDVTLFIKYMGALLNNYRKMGFEKVVPIVHHQGGNISALIKTAYLETVIYNAYKDLGEGWWSEGLATPFTVNTMNATLGMGLFGGHGGVGETQAMMAIDANLIDMSLLKGDNNRWNSDAGSANMAKAKLDMDSLIKNWMEILDKC